MMAVNMDKMKKSKKQKRLKSSTDWSDICGYSGDSETVGIEHDGTLEHTTDKAALVLQDGEKLWVPFSQIQDADDEALVVTKWWCDENGVDYW